MFLDSLEFAPALELILDHHSRKLRYDKLESEVNIGSIDIELRTVVGYPDDEPLYDHP